MNILSHGRNPQVFEYVRYIHCKVIIEKLETTKTRRLSDNIEILTSLKKTKIDRKLTSVVYFVYYD